MLSEKLTTKFVMDNLRRIAKNSSSRILSPLEVIDIRDALVTLDDAQAWDDILSCCDLFGFLNKQQGHRDLSRELIELGIKAATKLKATTAQGRLLHDLAEIHHQQGRHKEAAEMFEKSYSIQKAENEKFNALTTKHMLVLALRALKGKYRDTAYEKAKEVLLEARELAREDEARAPWVAHPIEVMSLFAKDKKDYILERQLILEATQIHLDNNQSDRSIMLGQCFGRLGQLSLAEKKYSEAKEYFRESLKYSAQGLNRRVAATSLRYLGDVLVAQKNYDEAMKNYAEAMDTAIDGNFTEEQIALSWSLSYLYLRCGQYYDALSELQNFFFLQKTLR